MVNLNIPKIPSSNNSKTSLSIISKKDFQWSIVKLSEIISEGLRFEASFYNIEARHAKEVLKKCKWQILPLYGNNGLVIKAFYPGRFKRYYSDKNNPGSIGFLGSSEMLDIQPKPIKFMTENQNDIKKFRVKRGWILLSRSGTIGNVSLVSKTLENYLISEHAIRLITDSHPGYIYSFLKTEIGQALLKSPIYGSVVDQVEPEHLESILVPNPHPQIKKKIHDLINLSYDLRDESNILLKKAENLLYIALKLPSLSKLKPNYYEDSIEIKNYIVHLSELRGRFDPSFHVPIVNEILKQLAKEASEIVTLDNPIISKNIILPGRFARVYVQEGQGVPFIGGKQIYELDPSNKKYLSLVKHGERIKKELLLQKNMVLCTCSGTIGKVTLVPKHWEGWTANQHIIRIVPKSDNIAGFLYVFLASEYGHELIKRFTYGSVVDEIDDRHVSEIPIPLLKDSLVQSEINNLALKANEKRSEAYYLEQEAIRITNEEVIYAE